MTLDSEKAAAVDRTRHYLPIDSNTPHGVKMMLINEDSGVGCLGTLNTAAAQFFTHWAPLPVFKREETEPERYARLAQGFDWSMRVKLLTQEILNAYDTRSRDQLERAVERLKALQAPTP